MLVSYRINNLQQNCSKLIIYFFLFPAKKNRSTMLRLEFKQKRRQQYHKVSFLSNFYNYAINFLFTLCGILNRNLFIVLIIVLHLNFFLYLYVSVCVQWPEGKKNILILHIIYNMIDTKNV